MNYRMVSYIIGQIVRVEGILMIPPLVVSVIYGESAFAAFLIPIVLSVAAGTLLTIKKPSNPDIFAKEGFVTVGLSWIIMSLIGALPFVIDGCIPSFVDAFFETVSGFTTTGASILTEIESLGRGMLFWRSFTHFVGGMGVLVFVLAILPQADTRSVKLMHVMRAEVPGPKVGKLVSKIGHTARIMYGIYIGLTVIEMILLLAGGMPVYDSIVNSFATAGTGGFAIKNASIAAYDSAYIDYVIGIFMFLFGVNFNLYYLILIGHVGEALRSEELRWYLIITGVSTALIAADIYEIFGTVGESVRYAFFQVTSVMSTTGFTTSDYNAWPALSKVILALLMFCGACVGSTTGGIKVGRIILLVKSGLREVKYMLHPRAVVAVRSEGKPVERDVLRGANSYMIVYIMLFTASLFLVEMVEECDLVTGFTAVSACLNNVGPGLGEVGPAGNFSALTPFTKILLSVDMLAGRLEIFPLLMLFAPSTWRGR
ncbi:MAG: TrkH family potassium uptake protein [Eubacteriales bacterium]|nr:TrkH family potassium uptake protein [Clostridiales bacterium]MDD7301814.1 TrkH family potassium uptake protein [Eubacteriales bacterium]